MRDHACRLAQIARATVAAGVVTAGTRDLLGHRPPGGAEKWTRTNHKQQPISLLEGPAAVAGLTAGVLCSGGTQNSGSPQTAAAAIATLGAGAFGLVDDLSEDTSVRTKGIKGHFGALAQGRVTTGALKVLGIGTSAFLAAYVGHHSAARAGGMVGHHSDARAGGMVGHHSDARAGGMVGHHSDARAGGMVGHHSDARAGGIVGQSRGMLHAGADIVTNTLLIAATANLLNLLDLRPGRALKSAAFLAAIPAGGELSGPVLGAVKGVAVASWPRDLGAQDMLGDGGANALGALVGTRLAFGLPGPVKIGVLAGVLALNLASEKVSFSRVIEQTPWLRAIDEFGRA